MFLARRETPRFVVQHKTTPTWCWLLRLFPNRALFLPAVMINGNVNNHNCSSNYNNNYTFNCVTYDDNNIIIFVRKLICEDGGWMKLADLDLVVFYFIII